MRTLFTVRTIASNGHTVCIVHGVHSAGRGTVVHGDCHCDGYCHAKNGPVPVALLVDARCL